MGDPLSGGIKADGIDPRAQFRAASLAESPAAKPYMTFPVKPEIFKQIIDSLGKLKGRTDDSDIIKETTPGGGTKYSFIDMRDNQPLAVMTAQDGKASLSLYKSPEDLAKRIDSHFVSANSIKEFVAESRADIPAESYAFKP